MSEPDIWLQVIDPPLMTQEEIAGLAALRAAFGQRWLIAVTSRGRWVAVPKPSLGTTLTAEDADALRDKIEREQFRRRPLDP